MDTGRQNTRVAPIKVVAGPDGVSFWATPLPWRKRNDLGNLINKSFINSINESIKALRDEEKDETTQIIAEYRESIFDWDGCLSLAFPGIDKDQFESLDIWEIRDLLCAACDVNGLDLKHMIDPKYQVLRLDQAGDQVATDGVKTTSSEDSGPSADQPEVLSN